MTAATLLLWACLQPPISLLGSGHDGGVDGRAPSTEAGAPAILGLFTISGCSDLSFPGSSGEPLCLGTAPLKVRLVLLAVGATTHRFQVVAAGLGDGGTAGDGGSGTDGDGGSGDSLLDEASSRSESPELTLASPGTYLVSLGVAGPGGTATAAGTITVLPAALGAPCDSDGQCQSGLRCLCGRAGTDGACPAGLAGGLCTRSCDGTTCPAGSVCMDLSRSAVPAMADGGAARDSWRQPICVPPCTGGSDGGCRSDFLCRELPLLQPGEHAGGSYLWGHGCFVGAPGAIGDSCLSAAEKPDPSACIFGLCEGLGLRDICSAPCEVGCPTSAACASFKGTTPPAPGTPRCLQRCDAMHPCADPLLDCLAGGGSGSLGFTLATEPPGTTVCAPRRCSGPTDCPGGQCVALGGASFCTR